MPRLVLASASASRLTMLRRAGIEPITDPADIDEGAIKQALQAKGATVEATADALAEAKAFHVSARHPGSLVIGSDQMLDCDGRWFDKPTDMVQAERQLRMLAGREHRLISSAIVAENGARIWHATQTARLRVRPLGDEFIATYLAAVGPAVFTSVGAYQIEGLGAQLFESVEGDFFTVMGMPLLPLLDFLRRSGALQS